VSGGGFRAGLSYYGKVWNSGRRRRRLLKEGSPNRLARTF
jgi:hypothetical protein